MMLLVAVCSFARLRSSPIAFPDSSSSLAKIPTRMHDSWVAGPGPGLLHQCQGQRQQAQLPFLQQFLPSLIHGFGYRVTCPPPCMPQALASRAGWGPEAMHLEAGSLDEITHGL